QVLPDGARHTGAPGGGAADSVVRGRGDRGGGARGRARGADRGDARLARGAAIDRRNREPMHPALTNGSYDIARVREDFPILAMPVYGKPLVYLDNAASA